MLRVNETLMYFVRVFVLQIDVFPADGVCFRTSRSEEHSILDATPRNFETNRLGY